MEQQIQQTWCGWGICGRWCAQLLAWPVPDATVSRRVADEAAAEIPRKLVSLGVDGHVETRFSGEQLVVLQIDIISVDTTKMTSPQSAASWLIYIVEELGAKGILEGVLKTQVEKTVAEKLPEEVRISLSEQGIYARIYARNEEHQAQTFFALFNNDLDAAEAIQSHDFK